MMKHKISFLILCLGAFALSPTFVVAQTNEQNIIDAILRQYEGVLRDHNNLVESSRSMIGGSEEEQIQSILNQIEIAGQAVQNAQSGGIAIGITPSYPEPHQEVTASFIGFGVNMNEAKITWFVDGKSVGSGIGITSIKATLGEVGTPTIISATIEPLETVAFSRSLVVVPSTVDLLWEALDAHTPPFYKGKALPSYNSIVKITAVANVFDSSGSKVQPYELNYSWSLNGRKRDLSEYSGFGKSTAYAFGNFLNRGHLVSAELSSTTRGVDVRKSTLFVLNDPEIVFYKKEALEGIVFERAIGSQTSISNEDSLRLVAIPYSFDMRNGFGDLTLGWKMNNSTIRNTEEMVRGEIPLITERLGRSRLTLEITTNKILQEARGQVDIVVE